MASGTEQQETRQILTDCGALINDDHFPIREGEVPIDDDAFAGFQAIDDGDLITHTRSYRDHLEEGSRMAVRVVSNGEHCRAEWGFE